MMSLLSLLLLLIGVVTLTESGSSAPQVPQPGIIPVISSNSYTEDIDLKFIKKAIAKTPLASFTNFPVVVQEIDSLYPRTLYRQFRNTRKAGKVIFRRNSNDLHKHVIILKEDEDHLDYTTEGEDNRIYVVLIQNPSEEKFYHVLYAYARNVPPMDNVDDSVITLNREKRRIEWDAWDERGYTRNKAAAFGWITCLESFFIPCKKVFPDMQVSDVEDVHLKDGVRAPKLRFHFVSEAGMDAGMNFDFFGDLDDDNHQAAFLGAITDTLCDLVQFFADAIYDASKNAAGHSLDEMSRMMLSRKNTDFLKLLMKDLKNIGFYSYPEDHHSRSVKKLMHEGYRIIQGLYNESTSDQNAEKMAISVFTNIMEVRPVQKKGHGSQRMSGRGATHTKIVRKNSNNAASSSSAASDASNSSNYKEVEDDDEEEEGERRRKKRGLFDIFGGGNSLGGGQRGGAQGITQQGQHVQGYIPGKVGGSINGEDWRIYCARPDLSEGDKTWCQCHKGKDVSFGLSEDLGDTVATMLSGATVNDNPAVTDEVFNTMAASVFCGTTGKVIDTLNGALGKQLGVDKLLGAAGQVAATAASIPGGYQIFIGHLINQGLKAATQTLGAGGLIGMQPNGGGGNRNGGGGLFGGLLGRRKRGVHAHSLHGHKKAKDALVPVETDVEIFGHVGWRTQDVEDINDLPKDQNAHDFANEVFIGLGTCPYDPVDNLDFQEAEGTVAVANLYHRILRTQCDDKQAMILNDMIDEGHFVLNDDKTLSVSSSCPSVKKTVLSERQFDRLSLAFSIAEFTQAYMDEMRSPTDYPQTPLGEPISRPVQVMTNFVLNSLTSMRKVAPMHFIKLARDLLQTLKTTFSKALQDFYRFKDCSICKLKDKTESYNDSLTLLGLIQFIIEGLGPIESLGNPVPETWSRFYKANRGVLQQKLQLYVQHN